MQPIINPILQNTSYISKTSAQQSKNTRRSPPPSRLAYTLAETVSLRLSSLLAPRVSFRLSRRNDDDAGAALQSGTQQVFGS